MCNVNAALHDEADKGSANQRIYGQDCIAAGLSGTCHIYLLGNAGDYLASVLNGPCLYISGSAGRFAADTMQDGLIDLTGFIGTGSGYCMNGGTLIARKGGGDRLGQLMRRGIILIDGDVGDCTGLYAQGGSIIVTGNCGHLTGDWLIGGSIFVAGTMKSLGHNAQTAPLTEQDVKTLAKLFAQHAITADATEFTKIVPVSIRPFAGGSDDE